MGPLLFCDQFAPKKQLFLASLFLRHDEYFDSQKQQHGLYFGYHHTKRMAKTDGLD